MSELKDITDAFHARYSTSTYRQLKSLFPGEEIEWKTFTEISKKLEEKLKPKKSLIIYKCTKFLSTRQLKDESILSFVDWLRSAAQKCNFASMTKEAAVDKMIKMQLVDG